MINKSKVLAIISARGGSKNVPRKNLREVAGKPLIAWTIEEAKKSIYIDRLILSSEDSEIIKIAEKWGCEVPFIRPVELAQDDTSGIEPVLHTIQTIPERYDYVILLQPTSPLRFAEDIDHCLEYFINKNAPACVSVAAPEKNPYWMFYLDEKERMQPVMPSEKLISRRQDLPHVYVINGAIYCAKVDWLLEKRSFVTTETVAFIMPQERSLDIDSELDLAICEFLLTKRSLNAAAL